MPLVLTRGRGDEIYIGDDIVVTVVDVQGSQVRVMIKAPNSVQIVRGELLGDNPKRYSVMRSFKKRLQRNQEGGCDG